MQRVTGIGGVFFHARDPEVLRDWYGRHLGIEVLPWGGAVFRWSDDRGQPVHGTTIWSVSPADGGHFAPGTASFMVNYRVADLDALLQALREEGCEVLGDAQDTEQGRFGWVMDPEGNKVELWQPPPGM